MEIEAKIEMKEVLLDGLRIGYAESGHGPPLVLLHGGMEDSRSWRWQMESLSDEFTVLAWDAPGCGRSSDIPESWRLPDYADALAKWLDALGVSRSPLLGLSWGSSLAIEFFRQYPHVPQALILAGAYAGWAGSLPPEEVAARLASVLAAAGLPREQLLMGLPGGLSGAAPAELIDELGTIWADNAGSTHPGGYRAMARSMAEADLRDVLPRISVPTMLIYGELDQRAPLKVAKDMYVRIPSSELVLIPGAGHLVNAEAPAEFNAQVRRFIRSVVRAGAGEP
jgi:pimeloyl-ACP methyl ester carboxylesterase